MIVSFCVVCGVTNFLTLPLSYFAFATDDGYGSDSGGSSDEDGRGRLRDKDSSLATNNDQESNNEPEWKRRRREKRLQDGTAEPEYRDRAKERREGTNADYASLEGLAQSGEDDRRRQAELSKYLGGDEIHTHLVKGLDKALAEKVRREEMGTGSSETGDLDQLLEDAYARKTQQRSTAGKERDWRSLQPSTELGKSVLAYLLQKEKTASTVVGGKTNPTIQKSIERSVLTFSLDSDVRRRTHAWDVPRMSVKAFGTRDNAVRRRMTPLNQHIIATISKKLNDGAAREKEKSKYHHDAYSDKNGSNEAGKTSSLEEEKDKNTTSPKADNERVTKEDDDDSDDDIFADAGEYVPEALAAAKSEGPSVRNDKDDYTTGDRAGDDGSYRTKKPKQSIFDNLLADEAPKAPIHATSLQKQHLQLRQFDNPTNKNVIDRDILGGKQEGDDTLPYHKRRGPQSAAMEGVSMSAYGGGYGEEMDVDFGGNDDDWRKRKKGGKEEGSPGGQDLADDDE